MRSILRAPWSRSAPSIFAPALVPAFKVNQPWYHSAHRDIMAPLLLFLAPFLVAAQRCTSTLGTGPENGEWIDTGENDENDDEAFKQWMQKPFFTNIFSESHRVHQARLPFSNHGACCFSTLVGIFGSVPKCGFVRYVPGTSLIMIIIIIIFIFPC